MGPLSAAGTQANMNSAQIRLDTANLQVKDTADQREKLDLTQPQGSQTARSQSTETRNAEVTKKEVRVSEDEQTQDLAALRAQGSTRRGSVLDLSI